VSNLARGFVVEPAVAGGTHALPIISTLSTTAPCNATPSMSSMPSVLVTHADFLPDAEHVRVLRSKLARKGIAGRGCHSIAGGTSLKFYALILLSLSSL
jgi:hypothetical protein